MTDDEILKLLESGEELTPELIALLEEYQKVQAETDEVETTKASSETEPYAVGSQCAATFAFEDHIVLLPSIVLSYLEDVVQVLILTPLTKETVPCSDYFGKKTKCSDPDNCIHGRSHGYALPTEYITSFDALGTTDSESLAVHLQYGKRVWCKTPEDDVWKLGNIIDQLHGPKWRIRLRDNTKKRVNVGIEHIMPFKSILEEEHRDEAEEWSESDRESDRESTVSYEDEDNVISISNGIIRDATKNTFGGWQVHTTGFAAKMMKKMGYVEGKGLGIREDGRVEPIQAYTRKQGVRGDNNRPGLGLEEVKKKKQKTKNKKNQEEQVEEEDDMFGLMNSLLGSTKDREPVEVKTKPKPIQFKDDRQANQAIAKVQSELNKAQSEYIHATEAFRRNKGSSMESQFCSKLKSVTRKVDELKKELSGLQQHVKRTKEKKDMYTF